MRSYVILFLVFTSLTGINVGASASAPTKSNFQLECEYLGSVGATGRTTYRSEGLAQSCTIPNNNASYTNNRGPDFDKIVGLYKTCKKDQNDFVAEQSLLARATQDDLQVQGTSASVVVRCKR